jgi:hypothetical protein
MDSQFNSLVQSFNSNYIQYKVTGNPSYQVAYTSAQDGLNSIINSMQEQIAAEKASISDFFKSGVEQKLNNLQATNRKLQRGILTQHDDVVASEIRNGQPSAIPTTPITTIQYVLLGITGSLMLGLSLL